MSKKSVCAVIPKEDGEKALILANRLKIIDKELMIKRDRSLIYIPLLRKPSEEEARALEKEALTCRISSRVFSEKRKRQASLVELLSDKLPMHLLNRLPRAMDFVGDIAIVDVPSEFYPYRDLIGEAILKANSNVHTVLAKAGGVTGTYRIREFNLIAGESKTQTIHKEHGCQYYVDVAKVYFSPRLSHEHNRVALLVKENETVIDLFTGVGPFAIQIAKTQRSAQVYALDVNPEAINLLERNIRLNRVEGRVHPLLGDAKQAAKAELSGLADRVVMNLPERAMEFVDSACTALKPIGGIVHFYSFVKDSYSIKNAERDFARNVERCGRTVSKIIFSKYVRATAPHEWQSVCDVEIR